MLFAIDTLKWTRGLVTDSVGVDASAEEMESALKALPTVPGGVTVTREVSTADNNAASSIHSALGRFQNLLDAQVPTGLQGAHERTRFNLSMVPSETFKPPSDRTSRTPPLRSPLQEIPGDLGRYGRRWVISVPADACLEDSRAGLCPRVLVSADDSLFVSEFVTTPAVTTTADDILRAELVSAAPPSGSGIASLSGSDAQVTSARWIEGWRGFEQQVVSVAASSGFLSGTFRLLYEDQATVPLAVNASAEAVEVCGVCSICLSVSRLMSRKCLKPFVNMSGSNQCIRAAIPNMTAVTAVVGYATFPSGMQSSELFRTIECR